MRFRYASTPAGSDRPTIDMTPMIDIVFNLLLFFLLSSSFVQHTSLEVKLPQASTSVSFEGEAVVVELTRDDRIFVQGKEVSLPDLPGRLKELYPDPESGKPLLIRADEHVFHGRVVTLLDIARSVGVSQLNVATIPSKTGNER